MRRNLDGKDALINGGEFEKIKEMTKEAVDIVK